MSIRHNLAFLAAAAVLTIGAVDSCPTAMAADTDGKRICSVTRVDDIKGCAKGDQILFLPATWGNEQIPVIAAASCDLTQNMVWTKGGLTCIYAGPRPVVSGQVALLDSKYGKLYRQVQSAPAGWTKMRDGSFWRITRQGTGYAIVPGMYIRINLADVEHDLNGNEVSRGIFRFDSEFQVRPDHLLNQVRPNSGAEIEVVKQNAHYLIRIEQTPGER